MFSYGTVYARKREQYMVWVSSYSVTRQKPSEYGVHFRETLENQH